MTLLAMYEMFHNGNKKDFAYEVDNYGPAAFAHDVQVEIHDGVLSVDEALKMLATYLLLKG